MFLLEVQAETNSTTPEKEVQVAIFSNESFSLEYTRFPIALNLSKKIYVQVEGKTVSLLISQNKQKKDQALGACTINVIGA